MGEWHWTPPCLAGWAAPGKAPRQHSLGQRGLSSLSSHPPPTPTAGPAALESLLRPPQAKCPSSPVVCLQGHHARGKHSPPTLRLTEDPRGEVAPEGQQSSRGPALNPLLAGDLPPPGAACPGCGTGMAPWCHRDTLSLPGETAMGVTPLWPEKPEERTGWRGRGAKYVCNSVLCSIIPDNLKSYLFILYLAATIKTFCLGDVPGGPEVKNRLAMQGTQILSVSR